MPAVQRSPTIRSATATATDSTSGVWWHQLKRIAQAVGLTIDERRLSISDLIWKARPSLQKSKIQHPTSQISSSVSRLLRLPSHPCPLRKIHRAPSGCHTPTTSPDERRLGTDANEPRAAPLPETLHSSSHHWLGKLANLNKDLSRGTAPHKPLLHLVVLDLFEAGKLASGEFRRDGELGKRIRVPAVSGFHPDPDHLAWHRNRHGF